MTRMAGTPTALPSGIVTFVFTDIEGSTRLLRRLGDDYADVLERHFELLRQASEPRGGHDLGGAGDSTLLSFADADDALAACADSQLRLYEEPWPFDGGLRVRMGVHSGLAVPRGDGYVALAVHQAARVMAAAHGGQVIVSAHAVGMRRLWAAAGAARLDRVIRQALEQGLRDLGAGAVARAEEQDAMRPPAWSQRQRRRNGEA